MFTLSPKLSCCIFSQSLLLVRGESLPDQRWWTKYSLIIAFPSKKALLSQCLCQWGWRSDRQKTRTDLELTQGEGNHSPHMWGGALDAEIQGIQSRAETALWKERDLLKSVPGMVDPQDLTPTLPAHPFSLPPGRKTPATVRPPSERRGGVFL